MSVKTATPQSSADYFPKVRTALAASPGFDGCSLLTLDALIEQGQIRRLGLNEALTRGGNSFDYMSIVLRGSLEASLMRHDGHRHLIYFVQPGELAGLIGLVDQGPHLYDMRAVIANTVVFLVPGAAVRLAAEQDASLSRALALHLAFRSRLLHERLVSDPSLSLELRVGKLLVTLARLHGSPNANGIRVDVKMSQGDLADWLGVSRQRINFAIQKLRKDGLIEHRRAVFHILDPSRLEALTRL